MGSTIVVWIVVACVCVCVCICVCVCTDNCLLCRAKKHICFFENNCPLILCLLSACLFMSVYMCLSVSVRVFVYRDYFIELLKCVCVFAYLFSVRLSAWRSTIYICLWICVYMFEYCNINYRSICVCFQSCHCIETCICVSINLCFNGNFNINANFRSRHSSICSNH